MRFLLYDRPFREKLLYRVNLMHSETRTTICNGPTVASTKAISEGAREVSFMDASLWHFHT
jgi:hypothetical protein